VIVLAGKGHEDYQEINGSVIRFPILKKPITPWTAWEVAHA
jgi:hypothetical protein